MGRLRTPAVRAVLLAALVALAGCSGFFGSGGQATPDADDVTPAPVPSDDASGTVQSFDDAPPGVAPGGRVNATRLRQAHREMLENRSFTMTLRTTEREPGADPFELVYAVENRSRYLVRAGADGPSVRYVDGTGRFERAYAFQDGEVVLTGEVAVRPTYGWPPTFRGLVHLGARDPEVTRIERAEGVFYRVYATEPPRELQGVSNYSMTAYVRPDGFVQTVDASYDGQPTWGTDRVDRRWTYAAVGTTTVTEPTWVTRAKRDPTFRGSERYPPGIDEFGLVDPHALWGAHQFYLRDRSFTLVRSGDDRWSQLPPAGTVAVENATTYLVTRRGRDTLYGDPSGTYYRAADARANATEGDDVVEGDRDRYRLLMTREHGARWLTMHESHVSRVERNGTTLFRLVVTHPPDGAPVAPEHFNAVFLVRKSGLIEEIRLDLRVRVSAAGLDPDDDRVWTDVTYRYEYRAVGSTTVSEPAWVRATKRNRTATAADSRSAGPPTAGRPAPRETGSPPPREGFLSGLS